MDVKYGQYLSVRLPMDILPSCPFCTVSHILQFGNDPIPLISLDFDPSVFNGPACSEPGFQFGCKLGEVIFIQRQIRDDGNAFAASTFRFSPHTNHGGLARNWRIICAGASFLELMAFGAKQFSPIVFSHCRITFFCRYLLIVLPSVRRMGLTPTRGRVLGSLAEIIG